MCSYEEKYTLPLIKLSVAPNSTHNFVWIKEIAEFIYYLCKREDITPNNILYNAFYDLDDSWLIDNVLKDVHNQVIQGYLPDLKEFQITSELSSKVSRSVYLLGMYTQRVCDKIDSMSISQIEQELLQLFEK